MQSQSTIWHDCLQSKWEKNHFSVSSGKNFPLHIFTSAFSDEKMGFFIKNLEKVWQAGGLPIFNSLPGLYEISAWPAWPVPGLKIRACACPRQAGTARQAGRQARWPVLASGRQAFKKLADNWWIHSHRLCRCYAFGSGFSGIH